MPALGAVLTPMVTPFDRDLRIDEQAAVGLMHHLVGHGCDGVVMCGTTGESPTLSDDEQARMIELAVGELGGRATVVAGAGSNDTRHAVHLTERATELGADAILSVTPYYSKPTRRGIVRHFEEVARATDKPVMLYNIPGRTATDMPNDLLAELAQIERVDAVKQSRDTDVQPIDGLDLYAGNDDMFARVLEMGGMGGVLVAAHLFGDELRRMVDEPERRGEIGAGLQDVFQALAIAPLVTTVKAALGLLGHRVGAPRLPLLEADERERAALRAMLERHGLLAASAA